MAPFISGEKRNYVFGGICGIAANASIKVHLFFLSLRPVFIYCNESLVMLVQMSMHNSLSKN